MTNENFKKELIGALSLFFNFLKQTTKEKKFIRLFAALTIFYLILGFMAGVFSSSNLIGFAYTAIVVLFPPLFNWFIYWIYCKHLIIPPFRK